MGGAWCSKKSRSEDELVFHETSDEHWMFGKAQRIAIKESLQRIHLQMTEDFICEYLDNNTHDSQWDHPNYTAFVHTKLTPLDNDLSQVVTTSECKVMILGQTGVGKSSLAE